MSYCTYTDVEANMQYMSFTATSKPTQAQVTQYCTEISQEMDNKMQTVGISVAVVAASKIEQLQMIAIHGVTAKVYRAVQMIEMSKEFQRLYENALKDLLANANIINATAEVTNNPEWTGESRSYESSESSEYFNINEDDW